MAIILATLITASFSFAKASCDDWFKQASLSRTDKNCEIKCASTAVDMGTFDCPSQCEDLCKNPKVAPDTKYLKGLTKGDREAIAKYPKDAIIVFEAKRKADRLTEQVFGKAGRNDESDAFRHFVWAALLTKELGHEKANYFLNAHELEPTQPKAEQAMDVTNNNFGVQYAEKALKESSTLELDQIEREALKQLKDKKLKVLSPSKKKIPDGYYSK